MIIRKRGKSWQLDCGMVNGRRVQLSFETKDGAQAEMALRKEKLKNSGHQGFALTDEMRIRVSVQLDRLEAAGSTIEQAVDFYMVHAKPRKEAVKFLKLRTLCLAAKEEQRLSKRYRAQLKSVWKTFGLKFDEVIGTEITSILSRPMRSKWTSRSARAQPSNSTDGTGSKNASSAALAMTRRRRSS